MKCLMAFHAFVAFISVSAGALIDGRRGFFPENSPNLSWLSNSSLELRIGEKILNILLTPTTNIPDIDTPCLFEGKVQEEPLAEVSVSGCINSNEILLSISSSQVPGGILDLALVDGITYDVTHDGNDVSHGERNRRQASIYEDEYADYFLPPGDETVEDETVDFFIPPPDPNQPRAAYSGPLPNKVILKTNVKYDNSLLGHFQNSHQQTKDWINRVISLAKPRMSHNSLSIRIDLQIDGVDHIDETLKANSERIYYLAAKRIPSLTSYFCKDIGGGIIGVAFRGAACYMNGYAVNINEMFTTVNSELRTARTYAHELGHNVGMRHDFASVHGGRGGQCDKQGLMSYGQDRPDQWSTCSNSDYKNWWKNQGFACMQESKDTKTIIRRGYAYQYFPYNGNRFDFKVKAKYDAHIAFDSDENDSDLYEIVIGGWGNSVSMVRRGKQGRNLGTGPVDMGSSPGQKGWTRTPSILSPSEFRGFWITTEYVNNKLEIKVGKEGENKPFVTGTDPNPLSVRKVGLSAFTDKATYMF